MRSSSFRVGFGVGGAIIAPGLRASPSRSCGGWVCGLGAVGASLVFGLVRGTGAFTVVLPSVVLVSRIQLAQRYRGNIATSFSTASSSRRETMVGGALATASTFRVGLGQWDYHCVWIVCSPIAFANSSLVDLIFISRYF